MKTSTSRILSLTVACIITYVVDIHFNMAMVDKCNTKEYFYNYRLLKTLEGVKSILQISNILVDFLFNINCITELGKIMDTIILFLVVYTCITIGRESLII